MTKLPTGLMAFLLLFCTSCSFFESLKKNKPPEVVTGDPNPEIVPELNQDFEGEEDIFEVQFVQNGAEMDIEDGIVRMRRAPFSILLTMEGTNGVYINAAWAYDERFIENNKFDDLDGLYPKVMAEPSFNLDRELYLSPQNYSYWFYDKNLDWHRFNDVRVSNRKVMGEKVVENLVFVEDDRSIPVEEIGSDLYLFFFAVEDEPNKGFRVRQRQYIKVEWN